MTAELATRNGSGVALPEDIEKLLVQGELGKLSPDQCVTYYLAVCRSLALNPLTRPFEYVVLQGKKQLYAKRDCADQLRRIHGVSVHVVERQLAGDVYIVTARATMPTGRVDEEIGAVSVAGLRGESLANAYMKATTKAKRRVTLSICGLGLPDETEVDTIPGAERVEMPALPRGVVEAETADHDTRTADHGTVVDIADDPGPGRSRREEIELKWRQGAKRAGELGIAFDALTDDEMAELSDDTLLACVFALGRQIKAATR